MADGHSLPPARLLAGAFACDAGRASVISRRAARKREKVRLEAARRVEVFVTGSGVEVRRRTS